jgi:predicted lipid-binding transport protein (Tim44 family)
MEQEKNKTNYSPLSLPEYEESTEDPFEYYAKRFAVGAGLGGIAGILGYGMYSLVTGGALQNARAMGMRVAAQGTFVIGLTAWGLFERNKMKKKEEVEKLQRTASTVVT